MSNSTVLILQATAFAAEKHRNQRRKDAEASAYINHPIAPAQVLAREADISDEQVLAAAALHDTVEGGSHPVLEALFDAEYLRRPSLG